MKTKLGTPEIVIAVALALLFALGAAFGNSGGNHPTTAARAVAAEVRTIAQRDEAIRGLRFKHVPIPLIVSPQQTQAESLRDLDRTYPTAQRAKDEELLELLGLIPPGTDLRRVEGDVSGQEVAGYYDTRRKRLAIVNGPAASDRVASEITLSHELNHALEDQRFGLHDVSGSGADDAASAYTALIEGTATTVMNDYARRYIQPGAALGSAFSQLGAASGATAGVPPYLQRSLEFSYFAGEAFVRQLYSVAHGWKLVNYALSGHPPVSTEQIMHPVTYLAGERPRAVAFGNVAGALGHGWQRVGSGTVGEFDTGQLLQLGVPSARAATAAAGWGGGRYELWERTPRPPGCAMPCRSADAVVLGWTWDSSRDAREFAAAARGYLLKGLGGKPFPGGAFAARGDATGLALGPSPALARRLAAAALTTR